MKRKLHLAIILSLVLGLCSFTAACGSSSGNGGYSQYHDPDAPPRDTVRVFLNPESLGTEVYSNDMAAIDTTNVSEGYVMARYLGDAPKAKVQIKVPSGVTYTYTLFTNEYRTFPLSSGDGSYQINIYENVSDDMYAMVCSHVLDVTLADEFRPFLYPNVYSWYTAESAAVALGISISEQSTNNLDYLCQVYDYVINNIAYDEELAASAPVDYVPDADTTLLTKKGICFDYAALMTTLLRSQGIPTKLEVGYSGKVYHAWISVYLEETGWVDGIIQFDGKSWSLMDPTLAAGNSSKAVAKYIGDGSNYTVKYSY